MPNNKTVNSYRNIIYGYLLKLYQVLMPFIIRTFVIYTLGIEYAGLNSLFISVLSVLNIAELGVGTIMVFYMYKPISEKNVERICALMNLYKLYYRIIGFVVLLIGLCLIPFLPKLIRGYIPEDVNLYILYLLNLSASVLSYWLFSYKNSLFLAHQRNDIISKVTILTDTIKYILQIIFLYIFRNYYYFVIVSVAIQILNNVSISKVADKIYPNYIASGNVSSSEKKQINSSIRDVFYGQLGTVITLSVDSIVISSFLGLVPLARYQNYYFVISALFAFFTIFYQSLRASIGTNIITKTKNENYIDYKFITYIVMAALSFCTSCLINLFQIFIELWVGKENLLSFSYVVLFVIYFFVYELSMLIGCYKDISGKWHADRFRPLITAIVNLISNIILVSYFGLYGVIISTVISFLFINIPWLFHRVFIDIFTKSQEKDYIVYLLKKILQVIVTVIVSYIICTLIPSKNFSLFVTFLINLALCTIISLVSLLVFEGKSENLSRTKQIIFKKFQ